ncbi:MAG: 30S ribosomal protein S12 methylthiotransferase RimO [Chitinispirillia bacterium]|nr:30S ribosomal protein S12 methylthiotransferase RimO [Chitinispirillia bacterium]
MLVSIQNLGCSKNQVDGERILQLFVNNGFAIAEDHSASDIIIVNTCAFIKEAQEEAIAAILDMTQIRKNGRCRTLIVSGCFSQRYRENVNREFPEVDIWAGVDDWEKLLHSLLKDKYKSSKQNHSRFERALSEPIATQYIKIAEGCSHSCSFCVIPSIRGKFKSRNQNDIIEEARWLCEKGTRELILVAQDTSFYGRDINTNLITLLETLLKNTQFPWIRMMYLHPQLVSDDLLTLIAAEERLCSYFDIPLQHISDTILKSMNRRPLSKELYRLVDRIKSKVSGATLRSSFILGYPGETEKEHSELKQFIQYARFHKMGVFPFSPEEGTKAYNMRPRPRGATVQRRCDELMSIQQEISRELLEEKIGSKQQIIIDRVSDDHDFNYEGRTLGDAPEVDGRVFIQSGDFNPGEIVTLKIIGASDYDLYAEYTA